VTKRWTKRGKQHEENKEISTSVVLLIRPPKGPNRQPKRLARNTAQRRNRDIRGQGPNRRQHPRQEVRPKQLWVDDQSRREKPIGSRPHHPRKQRATVTEIPSVP